MIGDRILLHACCGPCALTPVPSLRALGLEITVLFYNPNIHPLTEYLRRREGMEQVAARMELAVIFKDDEYDPRTYLRQTAHQEEDRCVHCYRLRLKRTLDIARSGGFAFFSTTLLYSRYQKHETIAEVGRELAGAGPVRFHYQDFREGWTEGIRLSREWGIYRQPYCGCIYSEWERYRSRLAPARSDG
jgi:epoxyqueuosine reductase